MSHFLKCFRKLTSRLVFKVHFIEWPLRGQRLAADMRKILLDDLFLSSAQKGDRLFSEGLKDMTISC